jgi:hypothetical protein
MAVAAIVVDHQVQTEIARELVVQAVQESQKFLVTLVAVADDLALQQLQSGQQGAGAMALVVVRHGAAAPLFSAASRAGYGPALESGSSPPRTAPARARVGSDTVRRRR